MLYMMRTEIGLPRAAIGKAANNLLAGATGISTFEAFAVAAYAFGRPAARKGATSSWPATMF